MARCAFGTSFINSAFTALPYNFLNDLTQISTRRCRCSVCSQRLRSQASSGLKRNYNLPIEAVVYIFCTVVGAVNRLDLRQPYPYTFAMLAGMIVCLSIP
ncbi:MAG: hypothetical protein ACLSA6_07745 [Holdemania massiliensis]